MQFSPESCGNTESFSGACLCFIRCWGDMGQEVEWPLVTGGFPFGSPGRQSSCQRVVVQDTATPHEKVGKLYDHWVNDIVL